MQNVGTPIAMIRGDRDRCGFGKGPGSLNSIHISNIVATGAKFAGVIVGLSGAPVSGVHLENISIEISGSLHVPQTLGEIPEKPQAYPQPVMFGALPAFGLFLRHVSGIVLRRVGLRSDIPQECYAIVIDDVDGLRCETWQRTDQRTIWLNNVRDSFLEVGATAFLTRPACRISGSGTNRVFLKTTGSLDPHIYVFRRKRCLLGGHPPTVMTPDSCNVGGNDPKLCSTADVLG